MADVQRVINVAAAAATTALRDEVAAQVRPIVDRTRNGLAAALGLEPRSGPELQAEVDDEGSDEDWITTASELTHFYGLDHAVSAEDAQSRAVAVWRCLAMAVNGGWSHWVALHDAGYSACGPAADLRAELTQRSEAQGIPVTGWQVLTTPKAILGLDYDLTDVAAYATELCDEDEADDFAKQVEAHDEFNWEHVAQAVTHLDLPGVSACWQIGHCLQVVTDRGTLDWSHHNPLPFALAVRYQNKRGSVDTLIVHGPGVKVSSSGVSVVDDRPGPPPDHATWLRQFAGRERFALDGIDVPAFDLGEAKVFDYRSNKDDKNPRKFKDYTHEHGEESGKLPRIFALGPRTFAICGGNMWIAPEGIRD